MLGIGGREGVVPGVGIHDDQGDGGGAEALDGSLGESEGEECNDGDGTKKNNNDLEKN